MLKSLKKNEEVKRLTSNILSLGMLQGANYILPLLTVPYLVRVLGPEYFGLLAFASATIGYFILLTDYGFNLSATNQISIYRNDINKINEIFSSVMIIKTLLFVIALIIMAILVLSFDKFNNNWDVYFITFGIVLGQVIFPTWLFQGMERMQYITYLNISAKLIFTVCIFIFVKSKDDYLLVPLFTSMGYLIAGIISLLILKKQFNVKFNFQNINVLKYQLKEGWHVFYSSISISLYTISSTFILGLLTNNTIVGYFSSADKIIQASKGVFAPISQAVYPITCRRLHKDKFSGLSIIFKLLKIGGIGTFLISLIIFLFSKEIILFLLGEQYFDSILMLKIMSFLPFLICISNVIGIHAMLNLGFKSEFSKIITSAAVIGLFLSISLITLFEGNGAAFSVLIVELFVTISMIYFIKRKSF